MQEINLDKQENVLFNFHFKNLYKEIAKYHHARFLKEFNKKEYERYLSIEEKASEYKKLILISDCKYLTF